MQFGWVSDESVAPAHPNMLMQADPGPKRGRRKHLRVSLTAPSVDLRVPENCFVNGCKAMLERQFYVRDQGRFVEPTDPPRRVFSSLTLYATQQLTALIKPVPRLTTEQFLASCGSRRRRYEAAAKSLESKPLRRSDSHIQFFVKAENTDLTKKPDAVPRAICPRGPRYCLELGRYIKALEKPLYRCIDMMWGEPVVMKGLNGVERAARIVEKMQRFSDPVAVGCDAKRFDQHVSPTALRWEHSIYRNFFPADNWLRTLLRWQLENHITGRFPDGSFTADLAGHRMSGDPNTSCGNTLIMSVLCLEYARTTGVEVAFINDGDDSVYFMERRDYHRFIGPAEEWFRQCGFRMEFEDPVDVIEQVEFCQAKPVWNGSEYIMCRNPHTCRAKDTSSFIVHNPTELSRWIRSVGEGGLSLAGGIPVLQSFYQALIRSTLDVKAVELDRWSGLWQLSRKLTPKVRTVSETSRVSYYLAWGVSPAEQRIQEAYYDTLRIDTSEIPDPSYLFPNDLAYPLFAGSL